MLISPQGIRLSAACTTVAILLSGCRPAERADRSGGAAETPAAAGPLSPFDESKAIDLTYPFNAEAVYWPTAESFRLTRTSRGEDEQGRWYASNNIAGSEHGGTHLDAPIHFARGRATTEQIPLARFMGPACVVDVRDACARDRDYALRAEDVRAFEAVHGRVPRGAVFLVHTGWGRFWPNRAEYLGSDRPGDASDLHFPGIGADAARLLVERGVDLVGLDTASLDHGPSQDFQTHRILNDADVPGLENVANLDRLPPIGAWVVALPMKIEDGTGGPCRVVAFLP